MTIDRETLASHIYAATAGKKEIYFSDGIAAWSFKSADIFLAEAERQRVAKHIEDVRLFNSVDDQFKNPTIRDLADGKTPAACEHRWVSDGGECYYCQKCKIPKVTHDYYRPAPAAEPRKAREWWLELARTGTHAGLPIRLHDKLPSYSNDRTSEWVLLREILE